MTELAVISVGCFVLGAVFILVGLYVYRAPNLQRVRRYYYFSYAPGALFSLFPIGAALIVFGFFPWIQNDVLRLSCLWLAVLLALIGVVIWTWSPSWTKPYWMREDNRD